MSMATGIVSWEELLHKTPQQIYDEAMEAACHERGKEKGGPSIQLPGGLPHVYPTVEALTKTIERVKAMR